jgi:hypothetical protein
VKIAAAIVASLLAVAAAGQGNTPSLLQIAADNGIRQLGSGTDSVFFYRFTRAGQRRETLVLTPAARFETTPLRNVRHACVSLLAAMPFNLGDGAILNVIVRASGQERRVIELALDPAHIRAHRAWLPIRFEVPADAGEFTIVFEVTPGARGDQIGDWVGVSPGPDKSCLFGS